MCQRVGLLPVTAQPKWVSSAVFVPTLDKVLLVDPTANALLVVSKAGETATLDKPVTARADQPALLVRTDDGFLLKLVGSTLLSLDRDLNLQRTTVLPRLASPSQPVAGPFYQWTVAGNSIVAYSSLRSQQGYTLGFLRLPSADPTGRPEMLKPSPNVDFYGLGYPYLTSLGAVAYFLSMEGTVELYKVPPEGKPVLLPKGVPAAFQTVPTLHSQANVPGDVPALYAEIERQTMPVGLYGGPDGFLYLLTRKPTGTGSTDWSMYRIDAEGVVRGVGHLKTVAKNLTVVPSATTWYFIERGDVAKNGRENIASMIEVPSSRLTELTTAGGEVCP
jgi:hypothetical protein